MIKLDEFHSQVLDDSIEEFPNEAELTKFLSGPKFSRLLDETSSEIAQSFEDALINKSEKEFRKDQENSRAFEVRNQTRWQEGFDLIEKLIAVCISLGDATSKHYAANPDDISDAKASALITLHARSVRVANEVFALMRCGFADGAYARWRTLHEHHVTCMFIAQSDDITSERYHDAWVLKCWQAAQNYEEYKERSRLQDFGDSELAILDEQKKIIQKKYSDDISKDWAWARSGLQLPSIKSRVTFADIEKNVKMDHWRPYTQRAHQEIHAGFIRADKGFGMSESKLPVHLVGGSNSGMRDPGQNLALSLSGITVSILNVVPTLDSISYSKAVMSISEQVFPHLDIGEKRCE